MLLRDFFVFIMAVFIVSPSIHAGHSQKQFIQNETETIYPEKVVKQFYSILERGELVVFGMRLDKAMLKPMHVEYMYDLETKKTNLKVYSELVSPIKVPSQENAVFWAICVIINKEGNIAKTEAHLRLSKPSKK